MKNKKKDSLLAFEDLRRNRESPVNEHFYNTYNTVAVDTCHDAIHLSRSIECIMPRVNWHVNCGLSISELVTCNKQSSPMRNVGNERGHEWRGRTT